MDNSIDYKKFRKKALTVDCVCIVIAGAVLYFGSSPKYNLPVWALIAGLVVAVAALVLAIVYGAKARAAERDQWQAQGQAKPESKEEK